MLFEPLYEARHRGGAPGAWRWLSCEPWPESTVETPTKNERAEAAGTLDGKTSLVIDDEVAIGATIKRLLSDSCHAASPS